MLEGYGNDKGYDTLISSLDISYEKEERCDTDSEWTI